MCEKYFLHGAIVGGQSGEAACVGNELEGAEDTVGKNAYAMLERDKPKDAYDFHFCLQNYPHGIQALATEFLPVIDDPTVKAAFIRLANRFRDEESIGPRHVVEIEQPMGESRAMRKFAVFTNVDDFLRALGIRG